MLRRSPWWVLLCCVLLFVPGILLAQTQAPEPTPTPAFSVVLADDIYVRGGPGQNYVPVGGLQAGDSLLPLSRNPEADWVLIRYHTGFGWIRRDLAFWLEDIDSLPVMMPPDLTPSALPGEDTATPFFPTVTPAGNWVVVEDDGAFVRAGPGRGYLRLGTLYSGDVIAEAVGRNADTTWIMIRFNDGFAWIAENLVDWTADIEGLPVLSEDALTPTATFTASATPTATDTATPIHTPTDTPTNSPTATSTATATATHTPTNTATATSRSTETPLSTATASLTPTPRPSVTPSDTATMTATPTQTESPTAVPPTELAFLVVTETLRPSATPTTTATLTHTPRPSATPSDTVTATQTDTATSTATPTERLLPVQTETPRPSATATLTDTPSDTPTVTASPTHTQTATPVPSDTPTLTETSTAPPNDTPAPTETAKPPSETPTEAAAAAVSSATVEVPATLVPQTTGGAGGGPAISAEALVAALIVLLVIGYIAFYLRGAAAVDRYAMGFVINECPVCREGRLRIESRQERSFGIPTARRTIHCDNCRSVLRETGYRRWRYAVDPTENPALHARMNERVLSEDELIELWQEPEASDRPATPRQPFEAPTFTDDEDN